MVETGALAPMRWGQHDLEWGRRTYIMGIVNVTPDSFSGEGLLAREDEGTLIQRAVEQAQQFVAAGATFIDVGGESTRPGASFVEAAEEIARVVPVVQTLRAALPSNVLIS